LSDRRSLLVAALAFATVRIADPPPELVALRSWLDSWRGVGDIIVGMHRQSYDVELRQYPDAWRANFDPTGIAHSIVEGSAWEQTPWLAVQRAAWEALSRGEHPATPERGGAHRQDDGYRGAMAPELARRSPSIMTIFRTRPPTA
jgi:hypothetical protein